MDETSHAPPHRLVEFLNAISRCDDPTSATRSAAELVAEELDAEVGAVVVEDRLITAVGFGASDVPTGALLAARPGAGAADLGDLGVCDTLTAPWAAGAAGRLIVARVDRPFDQTDRNLLMGMAGSLGLVLDMLRALVRERRRQRVLEVLLEIQRAISHREPLPAVLAAVTDGAAQVLDGCRVSLVLDDAHEPERPIVVGAHLAPAETVARAAVHVHGVTVGALLASAPDGDPLGPDGVALLTSFAEHASLALADARTLEVMEEAFRDPLTGTPNRQLFLDRVGQALARGGNHVPAVLFIDLDRFKAVNDTMGHAAGDELLRAVSDRIRSCTREGSVARFGGDEFAVLLERVDRPDDATAAAERIVAALHRPFTVEGKVVHVGATVGIASPDPDGPVVDAEALVRNADVAMYHGKAVGGGRVVTYDAQMGAALRERLELETELQGALERGELQLHYQPIVDLRTGLDWGVEALMRWQHPTLGAVPPSDFIPLAEAVGTILPIGRWAIGEACRSIARWRRAAPALTINVNVSVHQLRDPALVGDVRTALTANGLPGDALVLEITESVLLDDEEQMVERLGALKELGVRIALDDFGTGFSSLGYLRRYPVDELKIDRSFVSGGASRSGGEQLVRTIIELSRAYDLEVIAEGVETDEQRERLLDLGCRYGQGWLFSRAEPAERIDARLAAPSSAAPPV